jgi:Fungal protein kinase
MPVSQGTWEYMATDLIYNPGTIHSFVHDLESAFWVLFSQVLRYVPISWADERRASIFNDIMNRTSYTNPRSRVNTGSSSKLSFLTSPVMLKDFKVVSNDLSVHPLTKLLKALHRAHAKRYNPDDLEDSPLTPDLPAFLAYMEYKDCEYNHDRIIKNYDEALSLQWPEGDSAFRQTILPSNLKRALLGVASMMAQSKSNISEHVYKRQKSSPLVSQGPEI